MKEFLERVWNLTSSSSCVNSVLKGALKVPILTQLSAELCVMIKEFCTNWEDGGEYRYFGKRSPIETSQQ